MDQYKKINNLAGWLIFILASVVYLSTMERSASFWDCGEFISAAFKLQVVHSPGAPLFLMIARIFTLFAMGDVTVVAITVNTLSALASSFTILFLFWTITALAKKLVKKNGELQPDDIWAIIGAGTVGALACTFADSFWFSAVEGEVYALSSLFTALGFWCILKWEQRANEPFANRWLIFISYLMGLSIGVHLLNLLIIPTLAFVYYFKKYTYSRWGLTKAALAGFGILAFLQYGLIPGMPLLMSKFEYFFVNDAGMAFNSGMVIFGLYIVGLLVFGLYITHARSKISILTIILCLALVIIGIPLLSLPDHEFYSGDRVTFTLNVGIIAFGLYLAGLVGFGLFMIRTDNRATINTAILCLSMVILGASSYSMVVIRSNADPSIDMSNPADPFNLVAYINREQYGDRPLVTGPYYYADVTDYEVVSTKYYKGKEKYEFGSYKYGIVYDRDQTTFFPRIWSSQPPHVKFYQRWLDVDPKGKDRDRPKFGANLKFFFEYQVNWMYFRYFMWNFSGRLNDVQGHGETGKNGHWLTGFDFIDSKRTIPLDDLPEYLAENKAMNKFYMLPFILGLIGMMYQLNRSKKDTFIVAALFFFTGMAIVLYLNQNPLQPRERDYAYAGSIYTFCIWIGLGVLWFYDLLKKNAGKMPGAVIATLICIAAVPFIMAKEGWDDHDRSKSSLARDFAINYLESCAPNALLFTQGDNDTYPLWYAQEVEGIRTDIRIVNLSLLGVDWYINNLRRKINDADAVPFNMGPEKYRGSRRDVIPFYDTGTYPQEQYYDLREVRTFITR
ncbi:MAG: DUF2723 domain-containing protein [Bacteroidetes bacterium]|nr:DUF2723 domain-containing protein [Bacteroidota bacterium]